MEKRLNLKIDNFMCVFKQNIKNKMKELNLLTSTEGAELLLYIYDHQPISIVKADLQKRKRIKNSVPHNERCQALRANSEQCTRRKKTGERFCGTHIKGTPHGEIKNGNHNVDSVTKITVWAQDIRGIIYFVDDSGNVYDPQHVHQNRTNPAIIAKYTKIDGEYHIPSIF